MKLLRAVFCGLPGAERIEYECGDVNVFIGPNGSGKSTVLNLLKRALDMLARKTAAGCFIETEEWLLFDSAELTFQGEEAEFSRLGSGILKGCTNELTLKLRCTDGQFSLDTLRSGSEVRFGMLVAIEEIIKRRAVILELERNRAQFKAKIKAEPHGAHLPVWQAEVKKLDTSLMAENDVLEEAEQCELHDGLGRVESVPRQLIDDALAGTLFPAAFYVDSSKAIEESIPELIQEMCKLQAGKIKQNNRYRSAQGRLQHLLQHEVDFFEADGTQYLNIDGRDYRKASSGTRVSLAYFGLTHLLSETDIVIWDEPENGLHPTRRIRILDLIQADARQFFIATHALEFAPVFDPRSAIFRCDSHYEGDEESLTLSVERISGRTDNFLLLEAMGVQPARTLFTANVVIWVEGPTELIFYRHWLKRAFESEDLEEGFHYTIMHYGGGLLSYLDVADDAHRDQAFDALSICRNLAILVDSDLSDEPEPGERQGKLKPRVRVIEEQVARLNRDRPGSAMLCVTAGREIENYLPARALLHGAAICWKGYQDHAKVIDHEKLIVKQYAPFDETLESYFVECGATKDVEKNGTVSQVVRGKTQWGAPNKVEMMRQALTLDGLKVGDLLWGFAAELDKLADFIRKANEP